MRKHIRKARSLWVSAFVLGPPTWIPEAKHHPLANGFFANLEVKAVLSGGYDHDEAWASSVLLSSPDLGPAPSVCLLCVCSWGLILSAHRSGGGAMDTLPSNAPFAFWYNTCFLGAQVIQLLCLLASLSAFKMLILGFRKAWQMSPSPSSPLLLFSPFPPPPLLFMLLFWYQNSLSSA